MLYAMVAAGLRIRFVDPEFLVTLMMNPIDVQVLNCLLLAPCKNPRGFNFHNR